ncbi:MAG: T9SS type A sorting domain-containing protein [Candidatus Krumholzibacteriota bacterium]|nr:T9SS type A sorting domain-containing protein [Candidatus Krumholzibacteriota bacterium]
MRRILVLVVALLVGMGAGISVEASTVNHLMQIERVIGGVGGDATAQAVQLRMRALFQNFVTGTQIKAWDATGSNPVTIVTFSSTVANGALGSRILVASANFLNKTSPATVADFAMDNLIPASYLAAGSLTFGAGVQIYWRISWGGAGYTGPTNGSVGNDADGNYSPGYPGVLPSDFQALFFTGGASALSTNNAADYAITTGVGVFTNNAGSSYSIVNTASAAGSLPIRTQLHQNYPNPFNPSTSISFTMESSGPVNLSIFDTAGRHVVTLLDATASEGYNEQRWDGRDRTGRVVSSGIYYYRLTTPQGMDVRKMLMLK